jgi:tetratricopeptide (TPR) repeat protein
MAGLSGGAGSKQSAVDEAQQVMYDAWEAPTRQRAVVLAKRALEISADCADAYNLLAEEAAKSPREVLDLYRKGVEAGERALGKRVFEEYVGHFWGLLETRPYMRARGGLAQSLWETGQHEEAVEHYWDLLRLNPNDNQGIRYLLMPCLIELGGDEHAEKLFKQYEGDATAFWAYSRALLDFRAQGDSSAADKSLEVALDENQYVPSYLLGRKKMPRSLPDHYGFGDDDEAVLYARGSRTVWKATPGAMEWLAARVK